MSRIYIEPFRNKKGQWHARAVARNGNELARTSEGDGYTRRGRAIAALTAINRASVVVVREARPVKRRRRWVKHRR